MAVWTVPCIARWVKCCHRTDRACRGLDGLGGRHRKRRVRIELFLSRFVGGPDFLLCCPKQSHIFGGCHRTDRACRGLDGLGGRHRKRAAVSRRPALLLFRLPCGKIIIRGRAEHSRGSMAAELVRGVPVGADGQLQEIRGSGLNFSSVASYWPKTATAPPVEYFTVRPSTNCLWSSIAMIADHLPGGR